MKKALLLAFSILALGHLNAQDFAKAQNGKYYLELHSPSFIDPEESEFLKSLDIRMLQFLDDTTYIVELGGSLNVCSAQLESRGYGLHSIAMDRKIGAMLQNSDAQEELEIIIQWQYPLDPTAWKEFYQEERVQILKPHRIARNFSKAALLKKDLPYLLAYPEIRSIDIDHEEIPLNNLSRAMASADYAETPAMNNGLGFRGQGITIGVGDNADIQFHVDLIDRLINHNGYTSTDHGFHTTGMAAGSGIRQPRYRGMLPEATIVSAFYSRILDNAPKFYQDYDMTITNNSYGAIRDECALLGIYDATSEATDQLILDHPQITHVFAGGNNGKNTCPGFPKSMGQLLGQFQAAKNAIVVGNIDRRETVFITSSQGPMAWDFRLKPDLCADGENTKSCYPNNAYGSGWGSSMSAPAVAGLAGVLQQYYKQKYGTQAQSDLIKSLILNGAQDRGRPGPDVSYGYGRISTYRSLRMLENESFILDSTAHMDSVLHTLTITPGTEIAKILLYYHDLPGLVDPQHHLIQDLDMYILGPSGQKILPLVVDMTDTNSMKMPAIPARDSINNTEQIVLLNPSPGTYQIVVKGTRVSMGLMQRYALAIDTIPRHLRLRSPIGGETWYSTRSEFIYWDDYDLQSGTISLDYSLDQGASWNTIVQGLSDSVRNYEWIPPLSDSLGLMLRIRKSTGLEDVSGVLSTGPLLTCTIAPKAEQCPGFTKLKWNANPSFTDYLVYQKIGPEMLVVDSTTASEYVFGQQSTQEDGWYSVQPRKGKLKFMRATAKKRKPNDGLCLANYFDEDLRMVDVNKPIVGRQFTLSELSSTEQLNISISNQGNTTIGQWRLHYQLNGSTMPSIDYFNLSAHKDTTVELPSMDFSSPGSYDLLFWVENISSTDPFHFNDSLKFTVRQLANPSDDLSSPYTQSFETASQDQYPPMMGLYGIEEFDFYPNTDRGRVRSEFIAGNAQTGQKSLCLDASHFDIVVNTDSLLCTKNLHTLDVYNDDVRLDFYFSQHGQFEIDTAVNAVYVRGSETDAWQPILDLVQNQNVYSGTFQKVPSLEICKALRDAGQNLSSSTQFAFVQSGYFPAGDEGSFNGYTFDDLELYTVTEDINLLAIDTPSLPSCGLSNATPIQVRVRNSHLSPISNVEVAYRLDGGSWVQETLPQLPADTSISYTFSTLADFSTLGSHTLDIYVHHVGDSYRLNDSLLQVEVYNQEHVDSFPYLVDFESDGAYFTAYGRRPSWKRAEPEGTVIWRAASGTKNWQTGTKNYNRSEYSFLQSPCFDVTSMQNPHLSFHMIYSVEGCGSSVFCDGAWMEISDDGVTWDKLDRDTSQFDSWYSDTSHYVWSGTQHGWRSYSIPLPTDRGDRIQVRWVMSSDPGVEMEGIGLDDIHVYDYKWPLDRDTLIEDFGANPILKADSIYLLLNKDTTILAELKMGSKDLAKTELRLYKNKGPMRTLNNNYFLDRNMTVKPIHTNNIDTAMLRIYLTQEDIDKAAKDTNCVVCPKPEDFVDFGITKFSSIEDTLENNLLLDNTLGVEYRYLHPNIRKVPYVDGYYFEIPTWSFSEFWISTGLVDTVVKPQLRFDYVRAENLDSKTGKISWAVNDEYNNHHFEIQRTQGNAGLQSGSFSTVATVPSAGNNVYNVYDNHKDEIPETDEVYYYRIKSVDNGGGELYSDTIPLVFGVNQPWIILPNPFTSTTKLQIQLPLGKTIYWSITDMAGRLITEDSHKANAQIEQIEIGAQLAAGVYFLQLHCDQRKETFKINKR